MVFEGKCRGLGRFNFLGESHKEKMAHMAHMAYEEQKALFERSSFKTRAGMFLLHTVAETGELVSRTRYKFTAEHAGGTPEGRRFLRAWFQDGRKRFYDYVEHSYVKREDQRSTVYYAFPELRHVGLVSDSTEAERAANIEHFLDYVLLLVEDNPAYVEWLTMWLADILLRPGDKGPQPVALILCCLSGEHGLSALMARMLGERLVHVTRDPLKRGGILSDFNEALKHKLFVEFDEVDPAAHSRIKWMVKERTHAILYPRKDGAIEVRACARALVTTTAETALVERGDRMYAAFTVSTRRVGDAAYWATHAAKLRDESYVTDVAGYLLSLSAPYALGERPITDLHRALQLRSLRS